MILNSFDQIPLFIVYLTIICLLFLLAEIGFYIGKKRKNIINNAPGEEQQTNSIMGASLGLLAFLLAFSFNIVNNVHADRKHLVVEEANVIGTLFLRTEIFQLDEANQIKNILRDYVDLRIVLAATRSNKVFSEGLETSEKMQKEIWQHLLEIIKKSPNHVGKHEMISSVNELIDIHVKRLNAGFQRLPSINIFLLLFIAGLTLGLMGFQSGLNGIRVLIPRTSLILSLATVMIVIVDLDRPAGDLIEISQKTMRDLQEQIAQINLNK